MTDDLPVGPAGFGMMTCHPGMFVDDVPDLFFFDDSAFRAGFSSLAHSIFFCPSLAPSSLLSSSCPFCPLDITLPHLNSNKNLLSACLPSKFLAICSKTLICFDLLENS